MPSPIALAVDRERRGVAHADARRQPLPFGLRRSEDVLGLPRGVEEAVDARARLRAAQRAVERIADDRDRAFRAEALHHVVHGDGAPLSPLLSRSAQKFQNVSVASISPCSAFSTAAAARRRRCVACFLQIDAGAARQRLQQQPALVERAAGDGELLAFEIGDRSGSAIAPAP